MVHIRRFRGLGILVASAVVGFPCMSSSPESSKRILHPMNWILFQGAWAKCESAFNPPQDPGTGSPDCDRKTCDGRSGDIWNIVRWIGGFVPVGWWGQTDTCISCSEMKGSADQEHFEKFSLADRKERCGMMSWPSLKSGITTRAADEKLVLQHVVALQKLHNAPGGADAHTAAELTARITEIAYGAGESRESRQRYLEKFGCTACTTKASTLIRTALCNSSLRGLVELGAGNGHWARTLGSSGNDEENDKEPRLDVVAFDSMVSVPLLGRGVQSRPPTDTSHFGSVLRGNETIFEQPGLVNQYDLASRALLIVFPDPGGMAIQCLRKYVSLLEAKGKLSHALFIYAGEGRGGACADNHLFDELESGRWKLLSSCDLEPFGSKGYERLFVFARER